MPRKSTNNKTPCLTEDRQAKPRLPATSCFVLDDSLPPDSDPNSPALPPAKQLNTRRTRASSCYTAVCMPFAQVLPYFALVHRPPPTYCLVLSNPPFFRTKQPSLAAGPPTHRSGARHVVDVTAAADQAAHRGSLLVAAEAQQRGTAPDGLGHVHPLPVLLLHLGAVFVFFSVSFCFGSGIFSSSFFWG